MKRLAPLILLICSYFSVFGQDPYYVPIDKSKGLPSNSVYDMYQDTKGFFWFATEEGLCRYDGKNFKTYISSVVTSRAGTNINEDKFGRIWYTNFDNQVYYVDKGEIKSMVQNKTSGLFHKYHLLHNHLFIVQEEGVDAYDLSTLKLLKTIRFQTIRETAGDSSGYYVLDDYNDIYRIDTTLDPVRISRTKDKLITAHNGSIYFGNKGQPNTSIIECDKNRNIRNWEFNYNEFIVNICFADNHEWICTKNGVFRKNKETGALELFFKGRYISYVLKDKDDNIWISTVNEGVLFIPNFHNRFYKFPGFTPQLIRMYKNDAYVSGNNNSIKRFSMLTRELVPVYDGNNSHEISNFEIDSLSGHLLVCSDMLHNMYKGTHVFDCDLPVKSLSRIDDSYIAYAASGSCGLHKINTVNPPSPWDNLYTTHEKAHSSPPGLSKLIPMVRGKSTAYDPVKKHIYFATNKGMYVAGLQGVEELHYKGNTIRARKLIWYNNRLIILQNSGIILTFDTRRTYTEHPVFIDNELVAVNRIILRQHWLFLITNGQGAYVCDLTRPHPSLKLLDEIGRNEDIGDIAIWNDKYVITLSGGIVIMDIHKLKTERRAPSFVINEITVNNAVIDTLKPLKFGPLENNISINYSILCYNTTMGYPLYYRINGSEWRPCSQDSRQLDLISLNPDEYTVDFRLGHTGDKPTASVKFYIQHPLWELNWTWIAILAITTGTLLLYMRWRVNRLRTRKR